MRNKCYDYQRNILTFVSEGEDAFNVCDGRLFNKIIQELIGDEQSLIGSFVFKLKVERWF